MKAVLTFTVLFISSLLVAQEEAPEILWMGKLNDAQTGAKLSDVKISISREGKQITSFTSGKGKYKTEEYAAGFVYTVSFSKKGFVSKRIQVDASKGYFPEDLENLTQLETDVDLIPEIPNCKFDRLPKIAGKAGIDPATGQLEWDLGYAADYRDKHDDFFTEMNRNRSLVAQSKELYSSGKYDEAGDLLDELDTGYIASDYLEDLRSDIRTGKEKGVQAQYDKLITAANKYFDSGDLDKSESLYKRASAIKPTDRYPGKRLKLIDEKRKILLVDRVVSPVERENIETFDDLVSVSEIGVSELFTPTASEVDTRGVVNTIANNRNTSSANNTAIANRPAYIGDDLLAQKEKYINHQQELNARERNYHEVSYNNHYRIRPYSPMYSMNSTKIREHESNTFLHDLAEKGKLAQENRGARE